MLFCGLEDLFYHSDFVAFAVVADVALVVDEGHQRVLAPSVGGLQDALLQQSLVVGQVGVHQPPLVHLEAGGSHHEGHAAPLLHLLLQLLELYHEVLRGFAIVAEVDIEHASLAGIVPQLDAVV